MLIGLPQIVIYEFNIVSVDYKFPKNYHDS